MAILVGTLWWEPWNSLRALATRIISETNKNVDINVTGYASLGVMQ